MTAETCPSFDSCSAPLCSLNSAALGLGSWFVDEPICQAQSVQKPRWVKIQRRIQKLAPETPGVFTAAMLEIIGRVTPHIRGIPPDAMEQELAWIHKRSAKPRKPRKPPDMRDRLRGLAKIRGR